jgi:hypothetical protein
MFVDDLSISFQLYGADRVDSSQSLLSAAGYTNAAGLSAGGTGRGG